MTIVTDTNVVVSAAFRPGSEDRSCFVLLARRRCRLAVTQVILDEYRAITARIGQRECPDKDPTPFLAWLRHPRFRTWSGRSGIVARVHHDRSVFVVTEDARLNALRSAEHKPQPITPDDFIRRHFVAPPSGEGN